jgi:hypothetical protein
VLYLVVRMDHRGVEAKIIESKPEDVREVARLR